MSEFTAGNVILKGHLEDVQKKFPQAKVQSLNDKYDIFLTDDDVTQSVPPGFSELSAVIPILHFYNAEDHGWGYRVLDRGGVTASFDYSYWIEEYLFQELAEERYPESEPFELPEEIKNSIYEEIPHMEEFKKRYREQFDDIGLEAFAVFGVDPQQLEQTFAAEYDGPFDFVERFKETVGIPELAWINYAYDDEE